MIRPIFVDGDHPGGRSQISLTIMCQIQFPPIALILKRKSPEKLLVFFAALTDDGAWFERRVA